MRKNSFQVCCKVILNMVLTSSIRKTSRSLNWTLCVLKTAAASSRRTVKPYKWTLPYIVCCGHCKPSVTPTTTSFHRSIRSLPSWLLHFWTARLNHQPSDSSTQYIFPSMLKRRSRIWSCELAATCECSGIQTCVYVGMCTVKWQPRCAAWASQRCVM